VDQVIFQVFQDLVIKLEPALEHTISDALLLLEESKHLCQNGIVVHQRPSTSASAASVWGSQNVISMARYSAMAVDNSVWAGSRRPVVAYRVPSPRWQWAWSGRMPSSSARVSAWR